ncbi:hypothetical protein GCM10010404_35210 [Nonomuraea africana]|uniref:HEAT repeat domain-containing protein n=1 Tax=Nonomuraea africana TaxID=46171 RepID=A0ABR9KSD7_9ACTN|nr:hypothetical protein [Nonomuraea africana]MBE1564493.1 hypothetical protein [Nonomuraea africana]
MSESKPVTSSSAPQEFSDLWSKNRERQNAGYEEMMRVTGNPVPWAYEVWDEVVDNLVHEDNHNRAIAAQILCNLAVSDPEGRILKDLAALIEVTRDKRFVTARHCLQSLWKIGLAGSTQRAALVDALAARFSECESEKNTTLIRNDIIVGLRNLHEATCDETIAQRATALIETEDDIKYRGKYAKSWRQ